MPPDPLGGAKKNSSPLRDSEIFLASYPSVIYDYPADKIFCHIPGLRSLALVYYINFVLKEPIQGALKLSV